MNVHFNTQVQTPSSNDSGSSPPDPSHDRVRNIVCGIFAAMAVTSIVIGLAFSAVELIGIGLIFAIFAIAASAVKTHSGRYPSAGVVYGAPFPAPRRTHINSYSPLPTPVRPVIVSTPLVSPPPTYVPYPVAPHVPVSARSHGTDTAYIGKRDGTYEARSGGGNFARPQGSYSQQGHSPDRPS